MLLKDQYIKILKQLEIEIEEHIEILQDYKEDLISKSEIKEYYSAYIGLVQYKKYIQEKLEKLIS